MNLIFCLYSSSAEVTVCCQSLSVVMGADPGLPTCIQSHLLEGMQISRETKRLSRRESPLAYKEGSLGQHGQALLRCRRLHFPRPQRPSSSSLPTLTYSFL